MIMNKCLKSTFLLQQIISSNFSRFFIAKKLFLLCTGTDFEKLILYFWDNYVLIMFYVITSPGSGKKSS